MGLANSLPQLFLDAAFELYQQGEQAIQNFERTKNLQVIQQKSLGITIYDWTVQQVDDAIEEFTGTPLRKFSDWEDFQGKRDDKKIKGQDKERST